MERYIGLDAHASSCTLGVMMPSVQRIGSHVVETNARCLIEAVRQTPQPRHIRLGVIRRKVYKECEGFGALGCRAKGYRWVRSNQVRVKNRLKSLYRSRGGRGVYTASKRGEYPDRLPKPVQPLAKFLYEELDALEALKSEAKKAVLAEAKRHPEFRLVRSCPGLGPVRTAELLPIVVTPNRFQSKRGFWSKCGLGVVPRSLSDWVRTQTGEWVKAEVKRTRGLNRNFNHTLKAIFKGATTTGDRARGRTTRSTGTTAGSWMAERSRTWRS